MNAVAQAIGIDKTQLSKGNRNRPEKRTWKIELTWNMTHGMEENAQLNENAKQDDPVWLRELRYKSSVTRTRLCFLKVPTATSWKNGSCNGPAGPFDTMWTAFGSFVTKEVSYDLLIFWSLIKTLMIKNWCFVVKEAP